MRGIIRLLTVLAAGAGLAAGVSYLPAPVNLATATHSGPAALARGEPVTQTQSTCPGPEALGVDGLPDAGAQVVSVRAVAAPVVALPSDLAPSGQTGSLTVSGLPPGKELAVRTTARGQVIDARISTARSALISGSGALAPGTVATQWSLVRNGARRALVTSACLPPAASSWLIAGGVGAGRQERLVLTNPGPNPVTVNLTILGEQGLIESSDGRGLVVPGRGRTVVLLDAIAGSVKSPVVRVAAQGGEVAAVLSDAWLEGIVSRGGDDVGPVAAPAREQVIAGVPVEGRAILRVGVPGDTEAVVETRVLTSSGPKVLPSGGVLRVPGRSARDIDLGSLASGAYAIQVKGDVPLVAAAMVERRRAAGAPADLAWSAASAPIRELAGLALPSSEAEGVEQQLDLAASKGPASVSVKTVGAGGRVSTRTVAINADSVLRLPLAGATSVWVAPRAGLVRAAVLTTVADVAGVLLSLTPLPELTLTSTPLVLRELEE